MEHTIHDGPARFSHEKLARMSGRNPPEEDKRPTYFARVHKK